MTRPARDRPEPDLTSRSCQRRGLIAIVDLPGAEPGRGGGLRIWRGEIAVDQMDPGLLSDDPVNRQAEQRLECPHGVIGVRAEDAVDDDMGAVTAAVDLTLNGTVCPVSPTREGAAERRRARRSAADASAAFRRLRKLDGATVTA